VYNSPKWTSTAGDDHIPGRASFTYFYTHPGTW
jgi:hypothetical protein